METRKLFYENSHTRSFDATVLSCTPANGGWEIVLDATAFYPGGGGQPFDTGTLSEASVLSVREDGDTILHLCDKPLPVGTTVQGEIHWARRLDLMQQHTGEHILSGIIHQRFGYQNTGFHIGADLVTVDFDGRISLEELKDIEDAANRAIWENLPVESWYPSPEELPNTVYRTKRPLPWPVRIVEIPGYDRCACCAVHVARTGEVGFIKLFSCVNFHEGVRIEIACGSRALALLSAVYEQNKQVSAAFSAKILETGNAARQMNDLLAEEKFRSTGLLRKLFDNLAEGYTQAGDVVHFEEALSPAECRELCDRIAQVCGGTAAVFSGRDAAGYCACLVSKHGDIKSLGEEMCKALNGRGGGKGFFSGRVNATQAQIKDFFRK